MVKNDPQNKHNTKETIQIIQRHHSNHFKKSRHQHHAHSNGIILRIMCVAMSRHQHHAPSNGNILRIMCVALLLCVVENVLFAMWLKMGFSQC